MTAIAYRNGVIAADTAVFSSDIKFARATKISRRDDGSICGAAGLASACEKFMRYFASKTETAFETELHEEQTFEGIAIYPDRRIWYFDAKGNCELKAEFLALGAAHAFLLGAMAAGAGSEAAVELAIKYHSFCGGEVESYALETV